MVPAMCHTNPRLFYLLYMPAIDTDIYGASTCDVVGESWGKVVIYLSICLKCRD